MDYKVFKLTNLSLDDNTIFYNNAKKEKKNLNLKHLYYTYLLE